MDTTIQIIRKVLTDGSYVFDVVIVQQEGVVTFNAVNERAAETLAESLRDSIDTCSNHRINVSRDYWDDEPADPEPSHDDGSYMDSADYNASVDQYFGIRA